MVKRLLSVSCLHKPKHPRRNIQPLRLKPFSYQWLDQSTTTTAADVNRSSTLLQKLQRPLMLLNAVRPIEFLAIPMDSQFVVVLCGFLWSHDLLDNYQR